MTRMLTLAALVIAGKPTARRGRDVVRALFKPLLANVKPAATVAAVYGKNTSGIWVDACGFV